VASRKPAADIYVMLNEANEQGLSFFFFYHPPAFVRLGGVGCRRSHGSSPGFADNLRRQRVRRHEWPCRRRGLWSSERLRRLVIVLVCSTSI